MRKADLITGGLFLTFSVVYLFYLIPEYIVFSVPQGEITRAALRPNFLPRIFIIIFAVLSVLLIWVSFYERVDQDEPPLSSRLILLAGAVFALAYVFTYALEYVGFLSSSPVFLAALIMYFGTRDWRLVVPVVVLLPLGVNSLFWYVFGVQLPQGSIWGGY